MRNYVCESLSDFVKLNKINENLNNDYELSEDHEDNMDESLTEAEHKHDPKAHLRNRGDVVFPAGSSKVSDDKDHFPCNNINQARNAIARANQYSTVPSWYKGSLKELVSKVVSHVRRKYPDIEISKAAEKPGKG